MFQNGLQHPVVSPLQASRPNLFTITRQTPQLLSCGADDNSLHVMANFLGESAEVCVCVCVRERESACVGLYPRVGVCACKMRT